jgi:hypothetical protein
MATENIVMLACAGVLCTLHVLGGPLSGLFRKRRVRQDSRSDDGSGNEDRSMVSAE